MAELHEDFSTLPDIERIEAIRNASIDEFENEVYTRELDDFDISEKNESIHRNMEALKQIADDKKEVAAKEKRIKTEINQAHEDVQRGSVTITETLWIVPEDGKNLWLNSQGEIIKTKTTKANQLKIKSFKTGTND